MSIGYGYHTTRDNLKADPQSLGVKLGRTCIRKDISASLVAQELGVSRQTIYNWFAGKYEPQKKIQERVQKYLTKIKG